jgi:hypothetical protein
MAALRLSAYGVCPENAVIKLDSGKRFQFNFIIAILFFFLPEPVRVQDGKSGAVSPSAIGQTKPEPVGQNTAAENFSDGKPPTQLVSKLVVGSRATPMYAAAQNWAPIRRRRNLL